VRGCDAVLRQITSTTCCSHVACVAACRSRIANAARSAAVDDRTGCRLDGRYETLVSAGGHRRMRRIHHATATATAAAAAAAGAAVLRAAPWISMTAAHRPQIPATVSQ